MVSVSHPSFVHFIGLHHKRNSSISKHDYHGQKNQHTETNCVNPDLIGRLSEPNSVIIVHGRVGVISV